MFNYAEANLAKWEADVPEGAPGIIAAIDLLGELKLTLLFRNKGWNASFELTVVPRWYCHLEDEGAQQALVSRKPSNLFEVRESELIESLSKEPLFNPTRDQLHHLVVFGLNDCFHLIAAEMPSVRKVF